MKPMTVGELRILLKDYDDDLLIVINAKTHAHPTIGPTQHVHIGGIGTGFGWGGGLMNIYPAEPLRLVEFKDMEKK